MQYRHIQHLRVTMATGKPFTLEIQKQFCSVRVNVGPAYVAEHLFLLSQL